MEEDEEELLSEELEETEEEEEIVEEVKAMERNEDEEDDDSIVGYYSTTESGDKSEDVDLNLTMEEMLRKKKGKEPILTQISPPRQQQRQPSPKQPTPPSTGTTPPPEKLPTHTDKSPTHEQTTEKSPPPSKPTDVSTNIVFESQNVQVSQEKSNDESNTTNVADKPIEVSTPAIPDATAPSASASAIPIVQESVIAGNVDETLNLVVAELAAKKREDMANSQKFFKSSIGAAKGPVVQETRAVEEGDKAKEGEIQHEKEIVKEGEADPTLLQQQAEVTATEQSVLLEAAEAMKGLTDGLETQTDELAKTTAKLGGAPTSDATPSTTPKGKKQKPKPTPTRSSSRLRS